MVSCSSWDRRGSVDLKQARDGEVSCCYFDQLESEVRRLNNGDNCSIISDAAVIVSLKSEGIASRADLLSHLLLNSVKYNAVGYLILLLWVSPAQDHNGIWSYGGH